MGLELLDGRLRRLAVDIKAERHEEISVPARGDPLAILEDDRRVPDIHERLHAVQRRDIDPELAGIVPASYQVSGARSGKLVVCTKVSVRYHLPAYRSCIWRTRSSPDLGAAWGPSTASGMRRASRRTEPQGLSRVESGGPTTPIPGGVFPAAGRGAAPTSSDPNERAASLLAEAVGEIGIRAQRRYQSVEQLAGDIRRHVDGLPVRGGDLVRPRQGVR
jgi:hypothetical protein